MNDIVNDRVGPMLNPPHSGELIRESMDDAGWNVTETARRLGCKHGTLSRLLNGKAEVSANMALALEDIGWGTAGTGYGFRLATSWRRRVGTGPPHSGTHTYCLHDRTCGRTKSESDVWSTVGSLVIRIRIGLTGTANPSRIREVQITSHRGSFVVLLDQSGETNGGGSLRSFRLGPPGIHSYTTKWGTSNSRNR